MDTTQSSAPFLVREEPIRRIEPVTFAVLAAAKDAGDERALAALPTAMVAECLQCGLKLPGEHLLQLVQAPVSEDASPWIRRMRSGACPREGCSAERYRITFYKHPDVEWGRLFAAGTDPSEAAAPAEQPAEPAAAHAPWRRALLIRVAILLVLVLGLFVVYRIRYGGRIPLIREPEHFRVDPAPAGDRHR